MKKKLLHSEFGLSTFTEKQVEPERIVWKGTTGESQPDRIEIEDK